MAASDLPANIDAQALKLIPPEERALQQKKKIDS
jgi:hypothetical protein